MDKRRSETRYLCSHLVTLRWSDERGVEREETAVLENISASGASVQSEVRINWGTRIHLLAAKQQFRGTVRYCYWRDAGYFVGIEFDPDSQWSRSKFEPEHLIDPGEA